MTSTSTTQPCWQPIRLEQIDLFSGLAPRELQQVYVAAQQRSLESQLADGNNLVHSIDLHAVTGPGGGVAVTLVKPGGDISFPFKPPNPGCTS